MRTLEALIDRHGNVRLAEPIDLPADRRALVIVLDITPDHNRRPSPTPRVRGG